MELEKHLLSIQKRLQNCDDNKLVTEELTFKELKEVIENSLSFVDFCKFEFGEGITEGK